VTDRKHELEDAIADTRLTASDKAVFLRRLKRSDHKTAELPAKYAEYQPVVGRKTSLSLRQTRYAERHLERHGWLKISGIAHRGKARSYVLEMGEDCDCTGRVHEPRKSTGRRQQVTEKAATEGGNAAAQTADSPKGSTRGAGALDLDDDDFPF
jgi:hypothetical protein